jgi:hypothetical protein
MAVIVDATKLGLLLLAVLAWRDFYVERTAPVRRQKLLRAVLTTLVTSGTFYIQYAQANEMAFVKAVSAASAHAMFGGL